MNCPKCKGKTKVIDSRPYFENKIRRRRACIKCGQRFTTYEMLNPTLDMLPLQNKMCGRIEKTIKELRGLIKELQKIGEK